MKNLFSVLLVALLFAATSSFSQVNTIPAGGSPYANLNAAFAAINAGGVYTGAAVTVTITADLVEPAPAALNGGVFASCLIRPNGVRSVTGNFNGPVIALNGADNVTIDGLNSGGNSLTVVNPNAGTGANGVDLVNGALTNTVRRITCVGAGAIGATNGGRGINVGLSAAATGGNNDNTIDSVVTNGFRRGIQIFGTAGLFINERTIVRGCTVRNFTGLGVFVGSECRDNLVELCEVRYDAAVSSDPAGIRGINIQGCGNNIVRRNRVHSLVGAAASQVVGIISIPIIFTAPIPTPVTQVDFVNNMVALQNPIVSATFVVGIFPTSNPTTTAYTSNTINNTIRIAGSAGATVGTQSICLVQGQDGLHGPEIGRVINNICQNNRTDGDATSLHVGLNMTTAPGLTLEADNNLGIGTDALNGWDFWLNNTIYQGSKQYQDSCLAFGIGEQHTVAQGTSFVSATDLHLLPGSVGGNMYARPSALATVDYDGAARNAAYPYRGADEGAAFKLFNLTCKLESRATVGALPAPMDVVLRNVASPHTIVAINYDYLTNSNLVIHPFGDAVGAGPYFVSCYTMGHIETWSAAPVSFAGAAPSYNFTTAAGQAFGANQVGPAPFSFYAGDVNQDDIIDGTDAAAIDNDASNFVAGPRIPTDLNYDGIVDGSDGAPADNNAFNFIGAIIPPSPQTITTVGTRNTVNSVGRNGSSIFNGAQF